MDWAGGEQPWRQASCVLVMDKSLVSPLQGSAPTWTRNENIMGVMLLIMVGVAPVRVMTAGGARQRGGPDEAMKAANADKQRQYLSSSVLTTSGDTQVVVNQGCCTWKSGNQQIKLSKG
jgi:hypothetical protein